LVHGLRHAYVSSQPTKDRHVVPLQLFHRRQPPFCKKAPAVSKITKIPFHLQKPLQLGPGFLGLALVFLGFSNPRSSPTLLRYKPRVYMHNYD
jgi:hypothetical protein